MTNPIYCDEGNGKGKAYHVGPDVQLVLLDSPTPKDGWHLASRGEIDAYVAAEAVRSSKEPPSHSTGFAPAPVVKPVAKADQLLGK